MRNFSFILLAFFYACGTLAAQEVKITMAYAGGDPLAKELIHNTVAAFAKANPGVTIEEHPSIVGSLYNDFIQTLDSAGEFPDLAEIRNTSIISGLGKLAPLPEEITKLVVNPISFGGKFYAVSLTAQAPLGMIYNAKLFRDNKWAEPRTYAEFLALLDAIKARDITPIVVGGKDIWHMNFTFTKYFFDEVSAKNPNFIPDCYAGKAHFTDASMKRALSRWAELFNPKHGWIDPGFVSVADNQTAFVLASGKAAMLYSGTWMLQQIKNIDPGFEIGWFPVPSSADDRINLIGGSTQEGWAMSAEAAKNPAKAKAVLDFMKFFFRKDNYRDFIGKMSGIPSTVEKITYQSAIPVMGKILETYASADKKQLMWNQYVGEKELPPGFREYLLMQGMELLLGAKDVDSVAKELNARWEIVTKDFNPVMKK